MQAEYPDTIWSGPPRAYGRGRDGKAVRLSVVHYTAGSESRTSAEGGASYDKRRTDGTSCHVFHDPDSSVQEVLRQDRANSAFHKGNRLGIQHELCGTVQTRAQWLDAASDAILWRAARAVAKDCADFGLEPRRLSVAEVRRAWYEFPNGPRGICGHVDITRAFPEDGGTHTDPGAEFPWDIFLTRVRQFLGGASPSSSLGGSHVLSLIDYNGRIMVGDGMNLRDVHNGAEFDWIQKAAAVGFTGPWANVVNGKPQPIQVDDAADLAAYGRLPSEVPNIPGGEQLAAVVAAAVDSRIAALARATVDEAVARVAAAGNG